MAFRFYDLNSDTREYMVEEINADIAQRQLYISPRLNEMGVKEYPNLLLSAVKDHDEIWLAKQLRSQSLLRLKESRNRNGKIIDAQVPSNAHETLSEGEFNRFLYESFMSFSYS